MVLSYWRKYGPAWIIGTYALGLGKESLMELCDAIAQRFFRLAGRTEVGIQV